jgi:uncharacterized protein (DUF58 family)
MARSTKAAQGTLRRKKEPRLRLPVTVRGFPRITAGGVVFALLTAVVGGVGFLSLNNFVLLIFSLFAAGLIFSAWYPFFSIYWIRFERFPPRDIFAGATVRFRLRLRQTSGILGAYALGVRDLIDEAAPGGGGRAAVLRVGPRRSVRLEYDARFLRRGLNLGGVYSLETTFPFGFFRATVRGVDEVSFLVYPKIRPLEFPVSGSHLAGIDRPSPAYFGGDVEFKRLREYVPGDNPKTIHWRSTARHGKLMVRDEERYEKKKATILLDTHPRSHPRALKRFVALERAVSLAASAAVRLENEGILYRLALQNPAPTVTPPGRGEEHLRGILEILALVENGAEEPLASFLGRICAGFGEELICVVQNAGAVEEALEASGAAGSVRVFDASSPHSLRGRFAGRAAEGYRFAGGGGRPGP